MSWECSVHVSRQTQRTDSVTYVVYCGEGAVRSSYSAAGVPEALKGLLQTFVSFWRGKRRFRVLPTGDVTSWTRCLSGESLAAKTAALQCQPYQCRAGLFHPPFPRQYGPQRPCRTGFAGVSRQTAWWRCSVWVAQEGRCKGKGAKGGEE